MLTETAWPLSHCHLKRVGLPPWLCIGKEVFSRVWDAIVFWDLWFKTKTSKTPTRCKIGRKYSVCNTMHRNWDALKNWDAVFIKKPINFSQVKFPLQRECQQVVLEVTKVDSLWQCPSGGEGISLKTTKYLFPTVIWEAHDPLGWSTFFGGGWQGGHISKWNSVGKLLLLKHLLKRHSFLYCISPVSQHNCSIAWCESALFAFWFCRNPD